MVVVPPAESEEDRRMKIKEKRVFPARTENVVVGLKCDLCAKLVHRDRWGFESSEINDVLVKITMHRKTGQSWPDGGFQREQEIDICPNCWDEIVMPFLVSKGVEENVVETEW